MPPGRLLDNPRPPTLGNMDIITTIGVAVCRPKYGRRLGGVPGIAVPEGAGRRALDTHYLVLIPASDWRSVLAPRSVGRLAE